MIRILAASILAIMCLKTGAAAAQDLEKITIMTGVDPAASIFYVGRDAGILREHGFDVSLRTGATAGSTIPFVMTGEAIASHAASRAGLVNHLTDQNLVAVAQTTSLDHWYAVVADEDVKNVSDLVGRKVALALGTASDTLWAAVVAEAGIDPASVEIVNLEPPEMVAAISRGDIDAFVAWEPWVSKSTLTIPGTHVLRDGGGLLTDGTYIYMNRKWIEENKESAIRFIKAMAAANDFIVSKPEETQKLVGEFLRVDSVLMAALYPKLNYHMKLDEQSLGISKESVRQLQKSGRIENAEDFDYGKWFYPDLLKSVHPDAVSLQIR